MTERLDALPGEVRALVQRTPASGTGTETLIDADSATLAPLASAFKLYVLLAVADAVTAGELAWDDQLTVDDEARSLPSGELQDAPTGTTVTVEEAASAMIAISDNTATDLLVARVGRAAVTEAMAAAGHSDPQTNVPLLTTKDLFTLGWGDRAGRDAWLNAGTDERLDIQQGIDAAPLAVDVADVTPTAVWVDGLDWFASATDIAAVHEALQQRSDPVVRSILGANPGAGLTFDSAQWPYIAFKGGSSPGVLTGTWRAEAADGTELTVVLLLSSSDPGALTAAQGDFFHLAEDLFRLAA
ncbi:serine hydrolase [Microbacterium sp. NPDC089189]|uniref:serine hydrolase n=1 Tax=Microbacterium sp. NPDC089189 TaxID=3154972 RepID=UPI00342B8522